MFSIDWFLGGDFEYFVMKHKKTQCIMSDCINDFVVWCDRRDQNIIAETIPYNIMHTQKVT